MRYSRSLLWTQCSIEIHESDFFLWDIETSFRIISDFEETYSRFLHDNYLAKLNQQKSAICNSELKLLINFWKKLWDISQGYFDITVLPYLENNWYGVSDTILKEDIWYQNIEIKDTQITLHNNVCVEFWAYGKGYLLDKVWHYLSQKYTNFTLNFWGDIKVYGTKEIYLENPGKKDMYYGKIQVQDSSLTSSNGSKRVFWDAMHHLIDIKSWKSHNKVHTVFCYHKKSIFADGFATLLSVTPKELSKKIMKNISWLEAFVIYSDGSVLKSWRFTDI